MCAYKLNGDHERCREKHSPTKRSAADGRRSEAREYNAAADRNGTIGSISARLQPSQYSVRTYSEQVELTTQYLLNSFQRIQESAIFNNSIVFELEEVRRKHADEPPRRALRKAN